MGGPGVVITQPIHDSALRRLADAGLAVTDLRSATPLTPEEVLAALASANAQALICHLTDRIDERVLARPGLRAVATVSAGMDHIDLEAASRYRVAVVNTPDVLTEATADLTIGLMLAVARRITESDHLMRSGDFGGWRLMDPLMGADVSGATLGVVGLGRIGRAVARRAHAAFDMPILYTGSAPKPDVATEFAGRFLPLPDLLGASDFVTLHAPLTPATRHLIGTETLALMKPTAYLINTSRGPLVDEQALARALAGGVIAGAALDVFEHEPRVHPDLAARTERVVLTAHAGSATARTRERMSMLAAEGLVAALGSVG